jgi:hypothetical protein
MGWSAATAYCTGFMAPGYAGSWRLPTIGELRSLVRDCPATETGGACGVTDTCVDDVCLNAACGECPARGGTPYWPGGLAGNVNDYWSSSNYADTGGTHAWYVDFYRGQVDRLLTVGSAYVRCVRPGP